MSLRGKDFRCEIDHELHEQLRMIAEHQNKTIQMLGAELLEKAVVGEFHALRLMAERLTRSGIVRNGGGTSRNIAERTTSADVLRRRAEQEDE